MPTHKVKLKLFFAEPVLALERFVPVFHDFIRERALDELLIDVVDYAHVHQGPGVLLVGHATDYAIDGEGGRAGLLVSRKRASAPELRLGEQLARAFVAAELVATRTGLAFRTDELVLRLNDRLRAPNDDATDHMIQAELRDTLGPLYGEGPLTMTRDPDPRHPYTVHVQTQHSPSLATLRARLAA